MMRCDKHGDRSPGAPWIGVLCVFFLLFAASATGWAFGYPDFLRSKKFSVYEGEWSCIPDMKNLTPAKTITEGALDVSSLKKDVDCALKYTATLEIPIEGNYLLTQSAGDSCVVSIDGESVIVNDGVEGRRPRTIEKLLPLKAGRYAIEADCLFRRKHERLFELRVEGPDLYRVDRFQWLYFGWENDYPKSWSFMGGTVVPGRRQRVQFAAETDGKRYLPDEMAGNRRESIKWYLSDEFMPSPISEWTAGSIGVRIQHFGNRILDSKATAVYSRVSLTNRAPGPKDVTLIVNAGPEQEIPLAQLPTRSNPHFMYFDQTVQGGRTVNVDFVASANGEISSRELQSAGGFDTNYKEMAAYYSRRTDSLTHPVILPNQSLVTLYRSLQIVMLESVVNAENGDVEMRGSGGNPAGYYQYDRTFSHDVPNMVDQFIREGDVGVAKRMLESGYYQRLGYELEQDYLDAIPKYIIPYASYLQFSGDKGYFTTEVMKKIQTTAHAIHEHRDFGVQGSFHGIMNKSHTLDNPPYYLLVDNFAALHGLATYHYLCTVLGETLEARWAEREMEDLNTCVNAALSASMQRRNNHWYMSTFDDDSYFWKNGYDGNWIGTTMMMSTFPWDAFLVGFNLGGPWKDSFDSSIDQAVHLRDISTHNIPPGSWGAWWGAEYGTCYNAGMGLQVLFSDKHRTDVIGNLEFLLENQAAPYQWGESFFRPGIEHDWTRPAADYETWGLSFAKQALLEACVSVKTDGTVIIGRGIPDNWLRDGNVVAWKNVRINGGRKMDFSISASARSVTLRLDGDKPTGKVIFDLSALKDNIAEIQADGKIIKINSRPGGGIELEPDAKIVKVELLRQ